MVDEVGNDLGIGLRLELITESAQAFALLFVVFDDAVVHQGHALADMRMRIGFRHAAVGGPAGVADSKLGVEVFGNGRVFHLRHAPGTAHAAHVTVLDHGYTGGVIAPVLQTLQSFDQYRDHIATGNRTHYSAHPALLLVQGIHCKRPKLEGPSARTLEVSARTLLGSRLLFSFNDLRLAQPLRCLWHPRTSQHGHPTTPWKTANAPASVTPPPRTRY